MNSFNILQTKDLKFDISKVCICIVYKCIDFQVWSSDSRVEGTNNQIYSEFFQSSANKRSKNWQKQCICIVYLSINCQELSLDSRVEPKQNGLCTIQQLDGSKAKHNRQVTKRNGWTTSITDMVRLFPMTSVDLLEI